MKRQKKTAPEDKKKIIAKDKKLKTALMAEEDRSKKAVRLEPAVSEERAGSHQKPPPPYQKIKEPQFDGLRVAHPVERPAPKPGLQEQKSAPSEKTRREKVFIEDYQIPSAYNTTTLTLMARDPFWIFAYWEIAPSSIEEVKNKIGATIFEKSSYILRMYDTTYIYFNGKNANSWFDIEVGPHANNWYVSLWHDHVTYCGEIGIRAPDGSFFALARSNFVTTPRAGSSGSAELIWMELKEGFEEPVLFIAESQAEAIGSSPAKQPGQENRRGSGHKILLTEEEIRRYYSRLFPLLKQVISSRQGKGRYRIFLRHPLKGGGILLEDSLIRGLSPEQFIKRILLGSSEELVLKGASEFVKEGASEREQKKKKFFFDIGTELIVYGRTEPDAEVWLGEKRIKLHQDGTFTLRFALSDGKIPLDFFAQSRDKAEKRSIETAVERSKTTYSSDYRNI